MSTTIEGYWQLQAARRVRIIKVMLLILFTFLILCMCLCFWVTQPLLSRTQPVTRVPVAPARLEAHVRALSNDFSPRDESHPENLDRAAAYIRAEFEAAAALVTEQPYNLYGSTYRNVIAQFGPETPSRIIVGAHYDAAGPLPGADDNASGVAGLIELAYLLGQRPLPVRVDLVAFTLEEPPYFRTEHMGSAIHAASLRQQAVDVRCMFSLEMIGYFSDAPRSQTFPASFFGVFYPSEGNFIAVVGRFQDGMMVRKIKSAMRDASPLPVYSINAPTFVPGVDFSDQINYWNDGYDAVMITDTAFFRNHNYHTTRDTADTLDYKRMAMVVEGVYAALTALSR